MTPGIALQKMTTRPPDDTMVEVGIEALKRVLVADGVTQPDGRTPPLRTERDAAEEPVATLA
jgi:uncharacterized protein YqhQ